MLKISDIGIIADDLTGACDVGASFAPFTGPVFVYLHSDVFPAVSKSLTVVNTQSRLMSAKESKVLLKKVGKNLIKTPIIFKQGGIGPAKCRNEKGRQH